MIPVFCDWLKLRMAVSKAPRGTNCKIQQHTVALGSENPDWVRNAWVKHVKSTNDNDEFLGTSASSSAQLRYDSENGYLDVDGNLGKWGRDDAVWGYGVFSSAMRFLPSLLVDDVQIKGSIHMKRVDLTANVAFKSASDAYAYLRYVKMMKCHRLNPVSYQTGVSWVTENWSMKIYDKIYDLKRTKNPLLSEKILSEFGYVLRFEVTLRTDELEKYKMSLLSDWQNKEDMMAVIFTDKFKPLLKKDVSIDAVTDVMPTRLANAVDGWRAGRDYLAMVSDGRLSRSGYYKLRKELLVYGFDISQPCDVTALNIKPREIEFSFIDAPAWYWSKGTKVG